MTRARDLEEDFRRQPGVEAFRALLEPTVVAWKWSTGTQFVSDLAPFTRELSDRPAPSLQDDPPPGGGMCCQYGFDGEDRCVVARLRDVGEHYRGTISEQFHLHDVDTMRCYRFMCVGADCSLFMVQVQHWDGPRLQRDEAWTPNFGYRVTDFRYADGVVVERLTSEGDPPASRRAERVHRDVTGRVTSMTTEGVVSWTRDPAPSSVGEGQVVVMLSEDVVAALSSLSDRSSWWLVWLGYSDDGEVWSDAAWPWVSIATLADRDRLSASTASGWRWGWDWLDWTHGAIDVELRSETRDELDALGRTRSPEEMVPFLHRVASVTAELLATDATVVAVDVELQHLGDALQQLKDEQQELLTELGFAPRPD